MVRRHVRSEFAPDVFVFPGGSVDAADRDQALGPYLGGPLGAGDEEESSQAHWLPLYACAIRELFEEAGVLLARQEDREPLQLRGEEEQRFADYRRRLQSGSLSLLDLARWERLQLDASCLVPFSHWITPEFFPRRFDTWFFVARLPEGQTPLHDALETTESAWISPAEALRRFREGSFPLVFATQRHLERMATFASVEEMIAATGPNDLQPVMPRPVQHGSETIFLVPGDEAYGPDQ
jgi:8-oxo-dGTP pyrophosphatase MutT (NUDIX family)